MPSAHTSRHLHEVHDLVVGIVGEGCVTLMHGKSSSLLCAIGVLITHDVNPILIGKSFSMTFGVAREWKHSWDP